MAKGWAMVIEEVKPEPSSSSMAPPAAPPVQLAPPPPPPPVQVLPIRPPNPLLATNVPPAPSVKALNELLSAPPLSYAQARVAPPYLGGEGISGPMKPRAFCGVCGYWARVKCTKCGAKVCGLDCKGVHDETWCIRFYA
jgi:zinc finger HIT domain-containing protein 1